MVWEGASGSRPPLAPWPAKQNPGLHGRGANLEPPGPLCCSHVHSVIRVVCLGFMFIWFLLLTLMCAHLYTKVIHLETRLQTCELSKPRDILSTPGSHDSGKDRTAVHRIYKRDAGDPGPQPQSSPPESAARRASRSSFNSSSPGGSGGLHNFPMRDGAKSPSPHHKRHSNSRRWSSRRRTGERGRKGKGRRKNVAGKGGSGGKKKTNPAVKAAHFYGDLGGVLRKEKGTYGLTEVKSGQDVALKHGTVLGYGLGYRKRQGKYHYWAPDSWCNTQDVVHYAENTGEATVLEDGLYFVYSQVTFNNAAQRNSYSIYVKDGPADQGEQFMQCFQSVGWVPSNMSSRENAEYHTCYMGGVRQLKKGNRIYLQNEYENRIVDFRKHTSYWGIIKLA